MMSEHYYDADHLKRFGNIAEGSPELAKKFFDLPVNFPAGQDRVYKSENVGGIVIPRATATVSGANFEVLVGFEVTPEMAAFNREGKRFRPSSTPAVASQENTKSK